MVSMASLMNDGRDGRAAGRGGLGANCLIDDLAAVARGNELCNRYGLDTISVGAAIAFGMEAFERGLLKESDTDGIKLTWGNDQAMVAMVEAIGRPKASVAFWGWVCAVRPTRSAARRRSSQSTSRDWDFPLTIRVPASQRF